MANEPGNYWTADSFASYAENLAERYQMKCTIFDKDMLAEMGMGGILAVNKGSEQPPRMVVLEYHAADDAQTVLLVGNQMAPAFDNPAAVLTMFASAMPTSIQRSGQLL